MSAEKTEVPVLSMLEQLKQQHAGFIAQRDFAQNNLNQLVGAIFACEIMIKKFEDEEAKKGLSQENLGDISNGEINDQGKEEPSQE
jgi:hypothetical protein